MNNGTRPTPLDHRDADLLKTNRFGAITALEFPAQYFTDANLWMPDQDSAEPHFNNPPMPFGCTDYAQADISADIDGVLKNPAVLENVTHANANGGADIRQSLLSARDLGWIKWFYNVQSYSPLDFFDAFRYAIWSGFPEKRSVSWGTPWFPSWEKAALEGQSIMPMPTDAELALVKSTPSNVSWHNSKLAGWKPINGITYLINKSWQGTRVGDQGYLYFPREVVNVVMGIIGTAGFTATLQKPETWETIDVTIWQWFWSHWRQFLGLRY